MSYGNYEVVVYGGGETYRDTFNAVALMAGTGPMDSLFRLVLLFGLALGIFKAVFDFNVGAMMKWLFMAMMIYGVIWIPKVQVHVTDKFNVGLAGADVANVPLGIAFVAATSSEVGDAVIAMTEQAFADPQAIAYSQDGMIYGAKIFGQLDGLRFIRTDLAQSMQSFIRDCVADDIITGQDRLDYVENTSDLWGFISANPNPAGNTMTWKSDGTSSPVTCRNAVTAINGMWTDEITQNIALQQRKLNAGSIVEANGAMQTAGDTLAPMVGSGLGSTDAMFKQALTITALKQSVGTYAALAGGSTALSNFATAQGDLQGSAMAQHVGATAQKLIPMLQVVMTVLFIGMFPVMAPAFLLPGFGPKMMQGYFAGFLYLQLWGPMYVILNKIFLYQTIHGTNASAWDPLTSQPALSFANLSSVSGYNNGLAETAGMMMMAIPVLAAAMTKGAMDAGGHAYQMLGAARSGAEAAAQIESTRNISLGNTSLDNIQMMNDQRSQRVTSPYTDTGRVTAPDGHGGFLTTNQDGSVAYRAAKSDPNFSVHAGDVIRKGATQEVANVRDIQTAVTNAWTDGRAKSASAIMEAFNGTSTSTESRTGTGHEGRTTVGQAAADMHQVSDSIGRRFGMSERDSKALITTAAAQLTGQAGFSGGLPLGAKGSFGGNASVGSSLSRSKDVASNRALDAAKQELASLSFTSKVDASIADFASSSFSSSSGSSSGSRFVNANTFTSSKGYNETLSKLETEGQRYSRVASSSHDLGLNRDTDLTAAAVNYLARNPVRDAYNQTVPIGELLNPVGPDAARVNELREAKLEPFYREYVARVAADPSIEAAREAPSHLHSPGQFDLGGSEADARAPTGERLTLLAGNKPPLADLVSSRVQASFRARR